MNHGKSHNRGTDFFGKYIHDNQQKARDANVNLLCKMTNKLPWQYIKSGYSNASSPGTASSGSSTNSQCYGQSPDDLSVDSLIHSLLQVVNGDNFNGPASCNIQFPHTGYSTSNRCKDCIDAVCDSCSANRHLTNGFGATGSIDLNEFLCATHLMAAQYRLQ